MQSLLIQTSQFKHLMHFTPPENKKEVCALLFALEDQLQFVITNTVQVRNIKRGRNQFGISHSDFEHHYNTQLIGIYHSHPTSPRLSEEDKAVFIKHVGIKFQVIGFYQRNVFKLAAYTHELSKLNINII